MDGMVVFWQMLMVVCFMGVGAFLFGRGKLQEASRKDLSFLVAEVCTPAMILANALGGTALSVSRFFQVALLALVSFGILILLGILIPRLIGAPREERRFYHAMTVYYNIGFIGIPVVSAVLGQEALVYVAVFMLVFNILAYTEGLWVISRGTEGGKGASWKRMINPGTIACGVALVICLTGVPFPAVVKSAATYMGNCTTFLSMVVLGGALAKTPVRELLGQARLYVFLVIRALVVPILAAMALKMVPGVDNLLLETTVLLISLPAANLPLMMANQYGLKATVLSSGIILMTLFSVVTIPVVALFL